MVDDHWRSIRKTTTQVHVEYGPAYATLFATDIRLRRGPPVALALSLESNLRTRNKSVGTYIDARSLANGQITALSRLQLLGSNVIADVESALNDAEARALPWQLIVELDGKHHSKSSLRFRTCPPARSSSKYCGRDAPITP